MNAIRIQDVFLLQIMCSLPSSSNYNSVIVLCELFAYGKWVVGVDNIINIFHKNGDKFWIIILVFREYLSLLISCVLFLVLVKKITIYWPLCSHCLSLNKQFSPWNGEKHQIQMGLLHNFFNLPGQLLKGLSMELLVDFSIHINLIIQSSSLSQNYLRRIIHLLFWPISLCTVLYKITSKLIGESTSVLDKYR